jgi:hypothetical protein
MLQVFADLLHWVPAKQRRERNPLLTNLTCTHIHICQHTPKAIHPIMYHSLEGYRSTNSDPICVTPLSRVQNTMVYHSGNRGLQLWVKWLSSFIGKMTLVFLLKRKWYGSGERSCLLSALTPQWITFTSKSLKLWPLLFLFFLFHLFLLGCWSLYLIQ